MTSPERDGEAHPAGRDARRWFWPAVVLFALVLAARVAGAWWYALSSNPDYGVVVLMARNIVRGVDFPVFFYGQPYMGSLEPIVSAGLALLFGASPFVICLGTALVALGLSAAIYRMARQVAGPPAGVLAVALCLVGPPGYFHYMASPRGGYALGLLLTILLLHEGSMPDAREGRDGQATPWRPARIGLLGGLGFWNFWLTLPALAAAGLMLAGQLKGRVFSRRVWLPALAGFLAGSLPWWIWNARHGWASLAAAPASPGLRASAASLVNLMKERVPDLIGAVDFLPPGRARLAVHLLVLFLSLLPLAAVWLERRQAAAAPMRRLALAVMLYTMLFTLAFVLSSFGTIRTARYLLPLVPVFAVWVGAGVMRLAGWAGRRNGRARAFAFGLAVPGLIAIGLLVTASAWTLKAHAARRDGWHASARTLMEHPGAEEPLFAKFDLFGINWATDGRVCAVSPEIWRYEPYLARLEAARSPGVLENMGGFDHFLEQTRAGARYERVGRYRLHHHAVAPRLRPSVLPASAIDSITDAAGMDWTRALTDDSGESLASLAATGPERECRLTVRFKEPVDVSGVRMVTRGNRGAFSWSAEGYGPAGGRLTLACHRVQSGYYWSGPRFYYGGLAARAEMLWDPSRVAGVDIRLTLRSWQERKGIETLQILTGGEPPPVIDFAAAASAVRTSGVTRVFADRWIANQLAGELAGAVWTSREPALTREDTEWCAAVPVAPSSAVAVEPGEADHIRGVLARAGVTATEIRAGNLMLFRLHDMPDRGTAGPALAFYAGQLFCNTAGTPRPPLEPLDAAFLDGSLRLCGLSQWSEASGPSPEVVAALDWQINAASVPGDLWIFIHGLDREGRIAFMLNEPLAIEAGLGPAPQGRRCTTLHRLIPRPDTPDGVYAVVLGLARPGLCPRRLKPVTAMETDAHRLLLPRTVTVRRQLRK